LVLLGEKYQNAAVRTKPGQMFFDERAMCTWADTITDIYKKFNIGIESAVKSQQSGFA